MPRRKRSDLSRRSRSAVRQAKSRKKRTENQRQRDAENSRIRIAEWRERCRRRRQTLFLNMTEFIKVEFDNVEEPEQHHTVVKREPAPGVQAPGSGTDPFVHVKEEVVECLKEEAEWEDSTAYLYAGHEVKDEFVLGPEGPQPRDIAYICVPSLPSSPETSDTPAFVVNTRDVTKHPATTKNNTQPVCPTLHYICYICKKTYTLSSSLERHMLTHTGEKPYLCDVCNEGFTEKANLKIHICNIHNRQRSKTGVNCIVQENSSL